MSTLQDGERSCGLFLSFGVGLVSVVLELVGFGMVWFGLVGVGLIWFSLVWFSLICIELCWVGNGCYFCGSVFG